MTTMFYDLPNHRIRFRNDYDPIIGRQEMQTYSLSRIAAFMRYVLEREQLTIDQYLPQMGQRPYFLLAATGLGKTVAAPIHSYLLHCKQILATVKLTIPLFGEKMPRLWVVVPKISIAESQGEFMNRLFDEFIKSGNRSADVTHPTLFGYKTSNKASNHHAPIKFVTTGIFAIYAQQGWLDPQRDCVIIDEAHVTIESAEGVELAIAICRQSGIPVHYMSATVDTVGLQETLGVHNIIQANEQRFPVWMHNTEAPMESCIVDLVEKTLVHPDPTSPYFPHGDNDVSVEIRQAVLEQGRAKGFLIIINSFAGEDSDANTMAKLLRTAPYAGEVDILLLAGSVIRSPKEKRDFDAKIARIESRKMKYVIIATSVVEMGVTFPTLDFVATMDSGFEQITIGDIVLPEITPLPVNSLMQRMGRVGRKRHGIGFITNEVGAYYSSLSDLELKRTLRCEPIRLPLRTGSLVLVAYYSFMQKWEDPVAGLTALNLPSAIHTNPDRMKEFFRQRQRLLDLGIAVDNYLTEEGRFCQRYLDGGADLGYAIRIQQALQKGDMGHLCFYLTAAALSDVTLRTLADRDEAPSLLPFATKFNIQTGQSRKRQGVVLRGREIEFTQQSELIGLYNIVSYFANRYAEYFNETKLMAGVLRHFYQAALIEDCAICGFDPKQIERLLKGFSGLLKIFVDTNAKRDVFKALLGELQELELSSLTFPTLGEWDIQALFEEVDVLPGRVLLVLSQSENTFTWKELDGERSGTIYPDATCLELTDRERLTAKLIPLPGRGERKAGQAWKFVHGQLAEPETPAAPEISAMPEEPVEVSEVPATLNVPAAQDLRHTLKDIWVSIASIFKSKKKDERNN